MDVTSHATKVGVLGGLTVFSSSLWKHCQRGLDEPLTGSQVHPSSGPDWSTAAMKPEGFNALSPPLEHPRTQRTHHSRVVRPRRPLPGHLLQRRQPHLLLAGRKLVENTSLLSSHTFTRVVNDLVGEYTANQSALPQALRLVALARAFILSGAERVWSG